MPGCSGIVELDLNLWELDLWPRAVCDLLINRLISIAVVDLLDCSLDLVDRLDICVIIVNLINDCVLVVDVVGLFNRGPCFYVRVG